MLAARVFFLAPVFKVLTSAAVHARRLNFLAIARNLPVVKEGPLVAEPHGKENKNRADSGGGSRNIE
jgi:hypothetical protein